jgi:hypothetical protein
MTTHLISWMLSGPKYYFHYRPIAECTLAVKCQLAINFKIIEKKYYQTKKVAVLRNNRSPNREIL